MSKKAVEEAAGASSGGGQQHPQQEFVQQSLQANIATLQQRVRELKEENEALRKTKSKATMDTQDFVAYYQEQLEEKNAEIDRLRERLRREEMTNREEVRQLREQLHGERQSMEQEAAAEKRRLLASVESLQHELGSVESYRAQKADVDREVAQLRIRLQDEQKARAKDVQDVERRWMEDKAKLMDEQKEEFQEMKRRARVEEQAQLDQDVKRIVVENKRMREELRFHKQQTDSLTNDVRSLREQNRSLAREVELAADKEKEYATRNQKRARENKVLQEKIGSLESRIGALSREFEQRREADSRRKEGAVEELRVEARGLRQLLELKQREMATIRRYAHAIVRQRSEVEQFFLDALGQVKAEIRAKRAKRQQTAGHSGLGRAATAAANVPHLPPVAARSRPSKFRMTHPSSPSATTASLSSREGSATVDLSELTPEDREKVLRLLFARMNQAPARPRSRPTTRGSRPASRPVNTTPLAGDRRDTLEMGGMGRPFGLTVEEINAEEHDDAEEEDEEVGPGKYTAMLAAEAGLDEWASSLPREAAPLRGEAALGSQPAMS